MSYICADINRHPVTLADLGREIDNQFAASSFGKNVGFHA